MGSTYGKGLDRLPRIDLQLWDCLRHGDEVAVVVHQPRTLLECHCRNQAVGRLADGQAHRAGPSIQTEESMSSIRTFCACALSQPRSTRGAALRRMPTSPRKLLAWPARQQRMPARFGTGPPHPCAPRVPWGRNRGDSSDSEQIANRRPPCPRHHFAQRAVHDLAFGTRAGQAHGIGEYRLVDIDIGDHGARLYKKCT